MNDSKKHAKKVTCTRQRHLVNSKPFGSKGEFEKVDRHPKKMRLGIDTNAHVKKKGGITKKRKYPPEHEEKVSEAYALCICKKNNPEDWNRTFASVFRTAKRDQPHGPEEYEQWVHVLGKPGAT